MHIAIVGAGMIGAAAARHLALGHHHVTLIGPAEPANPHQHTGVFASHHDEGRITRALDPDPFWSRAGRDSIARYDQIARAGGIGFFTPVGCAIAGPAEGGAIDTVAATAAAQGVACDDLTDTTIAARFPTFSFPTGTRLLFEGESAGHISPRRLVAAQIATARAAGVQVVRSQVLALDEDKAGVTIRYSDGTVRADRVLVAAGGYTNAILPTPLPLQVRARTVTMMQLDAGEARRLAKLPSLIWLARDGHRPYLLPPIKYPDGQVYLKMGGDRHENVLPDDAASLGHWFRSGGDAKVGEMLLDLTHERIPGLRVVRHFTVACITTFSETGYPLIGPVGPRIHVATAGCGKAAKSSDELGRLAALSVTDQPLPDWAQVAVL